MRTSGVLMPISSLPSPYGFGTLGKAAKKYVDFLERGGQTFWQILPIHPTGFGDSPYASFSTYAGNPYMVDLEELIADGLLTREEVEFYDWGRDPMYVDYGAVYTAKFAVFRTAYARFLEDIPEDYEAFCSANRAWLDDYSLYMALKDSNGGKPWYQWEDDIKLRKASALEEAARVLKDAIGYFKMIQYLFFKQWGQLRDYAGEHGICIIGDVPIYVSLDSADVWSCPEQFQLDEDRSPKAVAGCPPDAFSEDGQLWGNPLYDWKAMKEDGYKWWVDRIGYMADLYDVVRIDHFRGFDSYYAIPYGDATARNGKWEKGPGMDLFNRLNEVYGELPIIVEDLGILTDSVRQLLKDSGYPGMKVLQFAFNDHADNIYQPHNYQRHCVVYTGTHDNETTMGWFMGTSQETRDYVTEYLNLTREEGYNWGLMRAAWSSAANIAIVPMMDLLGLGNEARLNAPSTTGGANWAWRALPHQIDMKLADRLHRKMEMYARIPSIPEEEEEEEEQ